jgi:hypothetical protein
MQRFSSILLSNSNHGSGEERLAHGRGEGGCCFEMAKQHPEHLEMEVPSDDSINIAEDNADVRAAYAAACARCSK